MGTWDSNSGPHAYMANSIPAEPSPQPLCFFLHVGDPPGLVQAEGRITWKRAYLTLVSDDRTWGDMHLNQTPSCF